MGRMEGKLAVVTGGTSGIGRAVAVMYAKEGAKVVFTGRNAERGAEVEKAIADEGGQGWFVAADLRNKDDVKKIYDFALEKLGHVNVLFDSAGVLVHKPYLEQTDEDLQLIFETNFRSVTWMMQQFIPNMVENGGGSIINVASISSFWPEVNAYYYGAMKAAVSVLSMNVAKEFARKGIRVNCILPGPINTGMTPPEVADSKEGQQHMIDTVCVLGRLGEPDDIAYMATYLGSDESSFVTGHDFVVDGGVSISN